MQGELEQASPSKAELTKFKAAVIATFLKEKRVNIRLSTPYLMDIQAPASEERMPYQTLNASVDHGPGYRVYYMQKGPLLILLIIGGDKSSQDSDIERAITLANNWQE